MMYYTYYDCERDEIYSNDPAYEREEMLSSESDTFIDESYEALEALEASQDDLEHFECCVEDIKTSGNYYLNHEDWLDEYRDSEAKKNFIWRYNNLLEYIKLLQQCQEGLKK